MSFFKWLFGKKAAPEPVQAPPPDPPRNPEPIRAFDSYGREVYIAREAWRDSVLVGHIEKAWDRPDDLFQLIVSALNDGFRSDVIPAAEHLYQIDPMPVRSTCLWAVILMDEGRLDEAERVLRGYLKRHGEEGVVLTNLAKLQAHRNTMPEAEKTLWHALETDPNQDNGLRWYEQIHRERGGDEASHQAMQKLARIPQSWRPQLWLAGMALRDRKLDEALDLYRESISRAGEPVPVDLLAQMSGDLGNHAHLPELLGFTEPHFNVALHGLSVGNNLIKAHLDLGQIDAARELVDQLYALKRPDWSQNLGFWDTEIAKARIGSHIAPPGDLQISMVTVRGPIWLRTDSPAGELFSAKESDLPLIGFLGSSAETGASEAGHQLSDVSGRLSRMIPLFLAEQIHWRTDAIGESIVPWVVAEHSGFVVSGTAWNGETASEAARRGEHPADYVVVTHLLAQAEPYALELRLYRAIDGALLGELQTELPPAQPETVLRDVASRLIALLQEHAQVSLAQAPAYYDVPKEGDFTQYLLRLEQALAVSCSTMAGVVPEFLSGEREILNGNIQLCLSQSRNVVTRLLLAQTLRQMKKIRPNIVPEFKEKVTLLQKEQPLEEPAQGVLQRLVGELFGS